MDDASLGHQAMLREQTPAHEFAAGPRLQRRYPLHEPSCTDPAVVVLALQLSELQLAQRAQVGRRSPRELCKTRGARTHTLLLVHGQRQLFHRWHFPQWNLELLLLSFAGTW